MACLGPSSGSKAVTSTNATGQPAAGQMQGLRSSWLRGRRCGLHGQPGVQQGPLARSSAGGTPQHRPRAFLSYSCVPLRLRQRALECGCPSTSGLSNGQWLSHAWDPKQDPGGRPVGPRLEVVLESLRQPEGAGKGAERGAQPHR